MNQSDVNFASAVGKFNVIDFTTFGALLGSSLAVGIYYGCIKKNQNTTFEYMFGGKSMTVFPIVASLVISHVSGISLLGVPAEVYDYGTQYFIILLSTIPAAYLTIKCFIPVFYPLQLTSLYEYLELRFCKKVRIFASLIYTLSVLLYVPVVIYIPSLAFHQVSGISVHHFTPIICVTCVFYTAIGGLKTVVWTDAIQGVFTLGSVVAIIVLGVLNVGGIEKVYRPNEIGERLELLNMNPSIFARNTFWTMFIGGVFQNVAYIALHPGSVQRYISLPDIQSVKRSVVYYAIGLSMCKVLTVVVGLIIYAMYSSCDPISTGKLSRTSQLIPYYVQSVAKEFPGLTGIFVSGLTSAGLSTMSAGLNTLAGTLYEDFFSKCMSPKARDTKANLTMKMTVVVTGCLSVFLVYLVEHMTAILQLAISLQGITYGAVVAVYVAGVLFPWVNKTGALWGMVASVVVMSWLIMNAQFAIFQRNLQFKTKPMFTTNCTEAAHFSRTNFETSDFIELTDGVFTHKDLPSLYALSYMYYTTLGTVIGVVVGILVSWFSKTRDSDLQKLNPDLVAPVMRRWLPDT